MRVRHVFRLGFAAAPGDSCLCARNEASQVHLVRPPLIHYGAFMREDRREGQRFSAGFGGQDWLAGLLRDVTGIEDVVPENRPDAEASVMVSLDKAVGAQSTERLSLLWRPGGLVLGTWPAELKKQAEATYRTGRGQRIVDFAAGKPEGWRVRPNVYLAYRFAAIPQRVYLTCGLHLDEYVRGWLGEDLARAGGHHRDEIRPVLWPWLLERGYAGTADEGALAGFLSRLGKRDAHLRPGIALQRTWSQAEAAGLNRRGGLGGELRAAVTEVLGVLDEPLPPACAQRPR
jgi:hypothetical protein